MADAPQCRSCLAAPAQVVGEGRFRVVRPCAACQDAQDKADLDKARDRMQAELARRAAHPGRYLQEAGVNVREYGHCTLDNWDPTADPHAAPAVRRWLDGDGGPWCYLYSRAAKDGTPRTGNGKTHLAVAALRELLLDDHLWAPGRQVRLVNLAMWAWRLRDAVHGGRSVQAMVDAACTADWLVLDDLGAERWTDFVLETLYVVAERRLGHPTLWTANYALDQLEQRRPEAARLASRIAGQGQVVELQGPDHRTEPPQHPQQP